MSRKIRRVNVMQPQWGARRPKPAKPSRWMRLARWARQRIRWLLLYGGVITLMVMFMASGYMLVPH